jgi:hypothetical protein
VKKRENRVEQHLPTFVIRRRTSIIPPRESLHAGA